MGRETPRKENVTDAISEITTTIATAILIRLACAIAAATSCFEIAMLFCAVETATSMSLPASATTFAVRFATISAFNSSILTASSLAARKRFTILSSVLITLSRSLSSASPRSSLKLFLSVVWAFAIEALRLASPVAPSRQTMACSAFTLASA